jgi:hypothetical protein
MDELLKHFEHYHIRDYKNGKGIRVKDLDASIQQAKSIIKNKSLNVEIFDIDTRVRSFSVRETK